MTDDSASTPPRRWSAARARASRVRRRVAGATRWGDELHSLSENVAALAHAVAQLEQQRGAVVDRDEPVQSCACTQARCATPSYFDWCARLGLTPGLHRWCWEKVHIARALDAFGVVGQDHRGLGFGVGGEPLVAWFAGQGCDIVATDLASNDDRTDAWAVGSAAPGTRAALERPELCPPDQFRARVTLRSVDMNAIPTDLAGFDFCWSACALEHLGTLDRGAEFVMRSLECVRPGGVAVHTTELNVSSDDDTLAEGDVVLYRSRDLRALAERLTRDGHEVAPLDLDTGNGAFDRYAMPTGTDNTPTLKVRIDRFVSTTFALVIRRAAT